MDRYALEGVVVTELGARAAVAVCGSLLAQLGATVVTIEPPDNGRRSHKTLHRQQFTAGKLSFAPRLEAEADRLLLDSLLLRSDVTITSSDVDPPELRQKEGAKAINVLCNITAFGATGPLANQPHTDFQVQALSGIMDTTGMPDGPPVPLGVPITDFLAGTYAASAVLAALRVKRKQGIGQAIDMALFDCAFVALGPLLGGVLSGLTPDTTRLGNRHATVAPWNVFRSRDGWIVICAGNQGQWSRLCELMGKPQLASRFATQNDRVEAADEIEPQIEQWTSRLSTSDCIRLLAEANIASGPIAPMDGFPREANLDFRRMIHSLRDPVEQRDVFVPGSPLRMSVTPGRKPERIPALNGDRDEVQRIVAERRDTAPAISVLNGKRPLAGVRIVEIGQYTTVPLCARHLAHLGADVIKIEPPGGDESRTFGKGVFSRLTNADKRSLELDLKSKLGVAALKELIRSTDVLVENLKAGTLSKFGFSPAEALKLNPRLVYCSVTGFGAHSLYAQRPAFDMVIQAMSGFMAALRPGGIPLKSGLSTADTMGAEMAILGVLAALEYRDRTGVGQHVDLSMQDITGWMTQTAWNRGAGESARPEVLPCADGYVVAETRGREPARAFGASSAMEWQERAAVMTREEVARVLGKAGIPAAPVLALREAASHPQTQSRRNWFKASKDGVDWPMLASPLRLLVTPPEITRLAPDLNEDGPAILAELGLQSASHA